MSNTNITIPVADSVNISQLLEDFKYDKEKTEEVLMKYVDAEVSGN